MCTVTPTHPYIFIPSHPHLTHLHILTHTLTYTHSHIPSCPDTHTPSHTHTFSHTQYRVPSSFSALPRIFVSSLLRILGSAFSNQPPGFLPPPSPLTSESPKLVMRKEEDGFRNGAGGSGPEGSDFRVLFPLSVGLGRLGTGLYLLPPFVWTQGCINANTHRGTATHTGRQSVPVRHVGTGRDRAPNTHAEMHTRLCRVRGQRLIPRASKPPTPSPSLLVE